MDKLRIMSVFGTRPEAIKMCPLVKELASRPEIESLCCERRRTQRIGGSSAAGVPRKEKTAPVRPEHDRRTI